MKDFVELSVPFSGEKLGTNAGDCSSNETRRTEAI